MSELPDFSRYCERICRHFWGEPKRAAKHKLNWQNEGDDYGGKSFDRIKRVWYDRGSEKGGSAIQLIMSERGLDFMDAWRWGHENGFIEEAPNSGDHIVATYDYVDENGSLLFQAVRFEPKQFRQRKPNGNGGWDWRTKGVRQVPYRLPELLGALSDDRVIFIVEGEKDTDRLRREGVPATTNAMGAGKWRKELGAYFKGANVVIIQDNDEPGREHALAVGKSLEETAQRVRVLDLAKVWPECPAKGDISDWLERGNGSAERLYEIADKLLWSEQAATNGAAGAHTHSAPQNALGILSSTEFVAGFVPPDYLIDGLCQKRFFYSLTAPTGAGKTAIAMLIAMSVGLGRKLAWRNVEQGRVLYLAGENPDDIRMRWIAMGEHQSFDIHDIPVFFRPGIFRISAMTEKIEGWAKELGGIALVIIDTSAAYFLGDEENSNVQAGAHARMMRGLCGLPGEPCVIACCHPVKHADTENMLPRGGGAYIAEVDGNLTGAREDTVVKLHWQGKFRGPDFEAMPFELLTVEAKGLVDSKGRSIPTVIASAISEQQEQQREQDATGQEDALLVIMLANDGASISELATLAGWFWENKQGGQRPHKSKVDRVLKRLKHDHLVTLERKHWRLSEAGKKAAEKAERSSQKSRA
jgi:hypothetical protein